MRILLLSNASIEAEYKTVIQGTPDGFWIYDMNGRFDENTSAYQRALALICFRNAHLTQDVLYEIVQEALSRFLLVGFLISQQFLFNHAAEKRYLVITLPQWLCVHHCCRCRPCRS
jgi:hypothetical protein